MVRSQSVGLHSGWLEANWFNFIQTAGIFLGLLFTALALRRDVRERRLSNLLALKTEHRELWSIIHENPRLARILDSEVDLIANPITEEETVFLRQMIVHFAVSWQSLRDGMTLNPDGFKRDVSAIFSLPLPRAAWREVRDIQHPEFVAFVEEAINAAQEIQA